MEKVIYFFFGRGNSLKGSCKVYHNVERWVILIFLVNIGTF